MKKILMSKKFITVITLIVIMILVLLLTGCNRQVFDTKYNFRFAVCNYDGNAFTLRIKKWKDYEGEQIQIIDESNNTYLISANKCYLREK